MIPRRWVALSVIILWAMGATLSYAKKPAKPQTRKKYVIKKYTQYDFTSQTVQGSLRAPEVFYIFQRKRSEGHQVVRTPASLDHHRAGTVQILKKELKP